MNHKFVIVSHILPPSPSGQAVMLYRLLSDLHPSQYCLISKHNYRDSYFFEKNWMNKLAGKYYSYGNILKMMLGSFYFIFTPLKLVNIGIFLINKYWRKRFHWIPGIRELVQLVRINLEILIHTILISYVVKKENCTVVIACTGDIRDLPAAFLASKLSGVSFVIYSFDDFVFQWSGIYRDVRFSYAKRITPVIFRKANTVIVTNEMLKKEYHKRYGIKSKVIYNPTLKPRPMPYTSVQKPLDKNEINLVFTGAIYTPHYDAFANLVSALFLLEKPNVRLHLFTAQPIKELENQGLIGPKIVYHPHTPYHRVHEILKQADVLFLPLGFKTPYPELIKTSFPGKMVDYLQAGKPILVHALKDSFVAWYFKTHRCGVVVDKNDPFELMENLSKLLADSKKQKQLSKRAIMRGKLDFNQNKSRKLLMQVIREASQ